MKQEIETILSKYLDVFGFVSKEKYIKNRGSLKRLDMYDDYAFLSDYKTIITLAIPYPKEPVRWRGKGYGLLSRYSYNIDYHIVFKGILNQITEDLEKLGIKAFGSVDTFNVDERYASYLSGIGYLGHSQFLIHKKYGSYVYLATILIDARIDDEDVLYDSCKECTKCIDACPSGALDNGFNQDKCISHLSQAKIPFTEKEIKYFKTMIYGCDICQVVCPKNKGINNHRYPEFEPSGIENVSIDEILNMSNKQYKEKYGKNASSWKGATIIKRNALCLIASQRLTEYREKIMKTKADFKDVLWYNKTASEVLKILDRE